MAQDQRRSASPLVWLPLALALGACGPGQIGRSAPGDERPSPTTARGAGADPTKLVPGDGKGGAPGSSSLPGASAGDANGGAVPIPTEPSYLPARVRRLSNYEYDRAVAALFQTSSSLGKAFAPDFRQNDFTQNAAQQVDAVYAGQLQGAARDLAKAGVAKVLAAAGCQASAGESCAAQVIASFGAKAYRRPLSDDEKKGLLAVFRAGALGQTFNDGLELVLTAMLQSPNFLFVTELGDGAAKNGLVKMTDYETASALSFLLTGGPPDQTLLDAAAGGKLGPAAARETQARRLLMTAEARPQVARLVKEWLQIDTLENTGKDKTVFPKYDELKPQMIKESDAFLSEAIFNDDGTLTKLLTADYTVADQGLAQFYGLPSGGPSGKRVMYGGTPRRGILMQAAFQAAHANDHETHPVKRGNTLLKKVLCVVLPQPGELNIKVVPPPPDKNKTTRERFTQHSTDPACAGCHRTIDPLGFVYENIDGMGGLRTAENNRPVETQVEVTAGDLMGVMVKDGADLAAKLAASDEVKSCFARNLFRFTAGQSGQGYEELFLRDVWGKLPVGKKVDIKEMLVAFAASDAFVTRRVP